MSGVRREHPAYRAFAENNIHLGATIVDPQGYRARASGTADTEIPLERTTATILREDSTGIWISGVKGVATTVPQTNELIVGGFHPPRDEESFWVVIPANAEDLRMYCREMVHDPDAAAQDHPLDARGEEIEAIVTFDEVFVPRERIISMKNKALHGGNFYNVMAVTSTGTRSSARRPARSCSPTSRSLWSTRSSWARSPWFASGSLRSFAGRPPAGLSSSPPRNGRSSLRVV